MNIVPTNFTVADYCVAMKRGEIIVNREYQRSDQVWPLAARSYLIETILLGYPMPKLSLYQLTDLKSKKTYKEIVDGQQRSIAIRDFYDDKLRLSESLETEEVAAKTYSELDDDHKARFVNYQLSVDLFIAAAAEEVREVFRRMNSYTVPLNPEEQRHATFQGKFKWFVNRLARRFDETFVQMGVFGQKQLVRMADTKLFAEIIHSLLFGIQTTRKSTLDALYRDKDEEFLEVQMVENRIVAAIDQLSSWSQLHNGPLMKSYVMYSLILAVTHMKRSVRTLEGLYVSRRLRQFDDSVVLPKLTALAEAIENPESAGKLEEFVKACVSHTNVREQRAHRFVWLCKALGGKRV